ncbi:MAG: permease [Bacillota bacterium]
MSTIILVGLAAIGFIVSLLKNKKKTKKSLMMAKAMFLKTLKSIFGILFLIGFVLALIPESTIKDLLGGANIVLSTIYGALIGTVTIIPAFIAFPLSSSLIKSGAHLSAIAAFITTLTMVGFATMPLEIESFGKKFTFIRNGISFILALFIALGMVIIL